MFSIGNGKQQHLAVVVLLAQAFESFYPVELRHVVVQQHQLRVQLRHQDDGLFAVIGFPDDAQVALQFY